MPFDPAQPANNSPLVSQTMRDQFNALHDFLLSLNNSKADIVALNTAIDGTSSNSNAVATLDAPFANDPPTLADVEVLRAKINELIAALRR